MQTEKQLIVSLGYNPHTDHFFIDFKDERGIIISVKLNSENIALNLSRELDLKINS